MVGTDAEDTMEQMGTYLSNNRETLGIGAGVEGIELEIIAALDFFVDPPSHQLKAIQKMKAMQWWNLIGQKQFPSLYKGLAKHLYKIPTSSAASESIWSVFDFVSSSWLYL